MQVFTNSPIEGDREAPNAAVVFLDGPENENVADTLHQATRLKERVSKVIVIGMGGVSRETMLMVASSTLDIYNIENVDDLDKILLMVSDALCGKNSEL